jgi:hypothetical protein
MCNALLAIGAVLKTEGPCLHAGAASQAEDWPRTARRIPRTMFIYNFNPSENNYEKDLEKSSPGST